MLLASNNCHLFLGTTMAEMNERHSELPPETADRLSDVLLKKGRETLEISLDLDKRLTNTNFLTNGGGAVAVLTYLATNPSIPALKVSLVLFTIGVIATGIELRALLKFFGELHNDASKRLRGFLNDTMTAREAGLGGENVGWIHKKVNHYAGWASQLCFIGGVLVGAYGFLYGT